MGKKYNFVNSNFVHWHCHSEYSKFDGLSKISDLVSTARTMGFPAVALTDHGNIGGWIKFIKECRATKNKEGKELETPPITPILGEEFYLCRKKEYKDKKLQPEGRKGNRHLNLFAMNWKGYQNLCALSERAWVEGFYHDPRIDIELISKFSEGIMCSSACLSSLINSNLLHNNYDKAKKTVSLFKDIFGDNFFLEVMYHGISEEGQIIPDIIKLSKDMDVPVSATNDCLVAGHLILTSSGFKNIEDINVGDLVLTHNRRFRKVNFVNKRKINKNEKLYQIKGYMGGDILKVTGNHPILVGVPKRRGNKRVIKERKWVQAKDLTTNTYLSIPKINSEEIFVSSSNSPNKIDLLNYYKVNKRLKKRTVFIDNEEYICSGRSEEKGIKIPRFLDIDDDFLKIIGYYIAEGHASFKDNQISFSFNQSKESHLAEYVKNYFVKFNLKPTVEKGRQSKDGICVRITSAPFTHLFANLCGKTSEVKKMPCLFNKKSFLATWSREQILTILGTYIEGDGHEPELRKPICIGSTSRLLINEISIILNSLNFLVLPTMRDFKDKPSFKEWYHKNPNADLSNWNDLHVIHISGNNKFIFQNLIGRKTLLLSKGSQNYIEDDKFFYVKISKISELKEKCYVYNMEVEEDESYMANLVSVHNCHYTKKEHGKSQEVLMCMSTSKCLNDPKHISFPYHEFYVKSAEEMAKIFRSAPQFITNTVGLLERIDSEDIEKNLFGGMRLPKFEIPKEFSSPEEYLEYLAWNGLKELGWDKSQPHIEALKKELGDLKVAYENNSYDFYTYFLIVWDYIKYAREKNIVVGCGRGSGYASVLLRCLKISYGPDPLKYNLIWERFLGFDNKKFIRENDFGFEADKITDALNNKNDREFEDDQGGVDRY